ncbi:NAC domain-containing protein 76-like [Zingiber officinale]|uniref:NAC domain-containing protein n=1 Tax=Zingiber officinale TaxID=94328 RepID=A0A8J5F759_ZINOF|nr:NAC domain-containing protein 76-like [Zingiber officinale]KAG6480488.1 hypothetical protein ZIOFF_063988 [Zingiber officinale]
MMQQGSGQVTVPPGFRFHPTDEELLHYYLRKKLAYEAIDLDVIREVDINKLEPWDLKDKCRVGSGPQTEWYFFSHKDKKYPTGTRTNRATAVGFWKATGRDKTIHLSNCSKRIGMRKTLVFYTGRAPQGQKTDWIMHEYRLDDETTLMNNHVQEDGWVVCRVFKKRNLIPAPEANLPEKHQDDHRRNFNSVMMISDSQNNNNISMFQQVPDRTTTHRSPFINASSIHLPQLLSTESVAESSHINPPLVLPPPALDPGCSRSCFDRFAAGDWSILDKLLASHRNLNQIFQCSNSASQLIDMAGSTVHRSPLQHLGGDAAALMKYYSN